MRTTTLYAALAIALATGPTAAQADVRARLNGFQEVPSISTDATGSFRASLKGYGSELKYTLSYAGIESPIFAHIHFGERHENGGVMVFLCNNTAPVPDGTPTPPACEAYSSTIEGVLTEEDVVGPADQGIAKGDFDAFLDAINAGAAYINVHSEEFTSGELRGQVRGRVLNRGDDDYEDDDTDD